MSGPLIATTRTEGLRALGLHGQPVVESYAQIVRYLREALSPAHAQLFAEPNAGARPGVVEWYAAPEGAAVARAEIAPEARPAFDAELKRLVDEIGARATRLKQSKETGEQLLGELLELALRIPSEENVYAIGRQPVLAAWGHVVDAPAADPAVLQKLVQAPPQPPAPPVFVAPPPPRPTWPWLLALLLLLLLTSLLLPWLAAPLLADLARPDGMCAIPEEQRRLLVTVDSEQGEEAALRRELIFVEAQIAERAAQCRNPAATAQRDPPERRELARVPDRVPIDRGPGVVDVPAAPDAAAPRPDTPDARAPDARRDPPPADPPRPDPPRPDQRDARAPEPPRTDPPRPDPPRPDQRQANAPQTDPPRPEDMQRRLDREHVQQREVSVSLAWDTQDDLDVVVVCPGNQQVSYRNPQGCNGHLDVDMNRSEPRSPTPVENVSWGRVEDAPRGRYRVQIDNQSNETLPYRVRVSVRGQAREFTGTVGPHARGHRVTEFDLPSGQAAQ